jgi:tRNA pseudouridine55 synthase
VEITEKELARLRADQGLEPRLLRQPEWRLPEGFPDPQAPIRALLGDRIVALLREREGKLFGEPVLRGPL